LSGLATSADCGCNYKRVLLVGEDLPEVAWCIEQTVEEFLHIDDAYVVGEI
jgi:hypothetical protein